MQPLVVALLWPLFGALDSIPPELSYAFESRRVDRALLKCTNHSLRYDRAFEIETRVDGKNFQSVWTHDPAESVAEGIPFTVVQDRVTRLDNLYYESAGGYGGSSFAESWPEDEYLWDLRTVGFAPENRMVGRELESLLERSELAELLRRSTFDVADDDGLRRVTAHRESDTAEYNMRWWLDPQRGGQIVRCEAEVAGQVRARVSLDLQLADGRWFPHAARYESWHSQSNQLREDSVLEFHEVRLKPDDVPALTLLDAGVDVGTNVTHALPDGSTECYPGTNQVRMWTSNGEKLVDYTDVTRQFAAGRPRGPFFERELRLGRIKREAGAINLQQTGCPLWRLLVTDFIQTYALDAEQAQRARLFLDETCRRAFDRSPAAAKALERAEDLQRAWFERSASDDADDAELESIATALVEVAGNLGTRSQQLRNDFLIPRLYRLLTREQAASPKGRGFRTRWQIQEPDAPIAPTTREAAP